jgi:hypothetical protein
VKLRAHAVGLPGKESFFLIVPLDAAHKAELTGHTAGHKIPHKKKGLRGVTSKASKILAGGKGFEPLFTESEAVSVIVISIV